MDVSNEVEFSTVMKSILGQRTYFFCSVNLHQKGKIQDLDYLSQELRVHQEAICIRKLFASWEGSLFKKQPFHGQFLFIMFLHLICNSQTVNTHFNLRTEQIFDIKITLYFYFECMYYDVVCSMYVRYIFLFEQLSLKAAFRSLVVTRLPNSEIDEQNSLYLCAQTKARNKVGKSWKQ